jgi:uncharacterized membrane protein
VGGDPERAERYIALERLQDPAIKIVLAAAKYSYAHGVRLDPYFLSICGLMVLVGMWSFGAFALLRIARLFSKRRSTNLAKGAEPAL